MCVYEDIWQVLKGNCQTSIISYNYCIIAYIAPVVRIVPPGSDMTGYCSMRMGDLQWGDNGVAMTYSRLHMALAHVYSLHMLAHLHI